MHPCVKMIRLSLSPSSQPSMALSKSQCNSLGWDVKYTRGHPHAQTGGLSKGSRHATNRRKQNMPMLCALQLCPSLGRQSFKRATSDKSSSGTGDALAIRCVGVSAKPKTERERLVTTEFDAPFPSPRADSVTPRLSVTMHMTAVAAFAITNADAAADSRPART